MAIFGEMNILKGIGTPTGIDVVMGIDTSGGIDPDTDIPVHLVQETILVAMIK